MKIPSLLLVLFFIVFHSYSQKTQFDLKDKKNTCCLWRLGRSSTQILRRKDCKLAQKSKSNSYSSRQHFYLFQFGVIAGTGFDCTTHNYE